MRERVGLLDGFIASIAFIGRPISSDAVTGYDSLCSATRLHLFQLTSVYAMVQREMVWYKLQLIVRI